jgi:hypothetical protein
MNNAALRLTAGLALFVAGFAVQAEITTTTAFNSGSSATEDFKFEKVPAPSQTDAANEAKISLLDGDRDSNGSDLACLNDGKLPQDDDQPAASFFFAPNSDGGRLLFDLGKVIAIKQVNTYSWHANAAGSTRGPQVYKLYAADGEGAGFDMRKASSGDPVESGWTLVADVDARPKEGDWGGQYGVSIADSDGGDVAKCRYVLLVASRTESDDPFGNTFYSEIDIVDGQEHAAPAATVEPVIETVEVEDGKYQIEFDTSQVPEIRPWVEETLKPTCVAWYPKIVKMLPSDDYEAPDRFRITFRRDMNGVAYCSGRRINCAAEWFLNNLEGEAAGAVVHEMVHVVQQYGRARGGERNPGWMVEGLADYIRWFLYEAEDQRPRPNPERAKYTDSYRTTAAFLDYVVREHDDDAITKFNAAMRDGEYGEALWKEYTGKTVDELWSDYIATLKETE